MESIGAEVGQKMRSAIKAKLLELDCYVDDELPDYIMVMVANKRSKSQMTEDLNLFLSKKTSAFVNWLHIVLKKLREVSVTNPDVYKKVTKRKYVDNFDEMKEQKIKHTNEVKKEDACEKSLTDNLPITTIYLGEKTREKSLEIPILTNVNLCTKEELEEVEKRITIVKNHLRDSMEDQQLNQERQNGILQDTRQLITDKYRTVEFQEDDADISKYSIINQSPECENALNFPEYEDIDVHSESRTEAVCERKKHSPITFEHDTVLKRKSVQDRLGEKVIETKNQKRIKLSEFRKEEEKFLGYHQDGTERHKNKQFFYKGTTKERVNKIKGGVFKSNKFNSRRPVNRSGLSKHEVMSKIYVPLKEQTNQSEELNKREVKSVVQVKPRIIPADAPQPNKTLLLKAMAEAQKSIVQALKPRSAMLEKGSLLRKKSLTGNSKPSRKLLDCDKSKLRNMILSNLSNDQEDNDVLNEIYLPKTLEQNFNEALDYIPSLKSFREAENKANKKEEILPEEQLVTSQSIHNKYELQNAPAEISGTKKSVKLRLAKRKKSPSPIIFDRITRKIASKTTVPEKSISLVRPLLPLRIKERCKYWPTCRQGSKCEFVHPSTNCDNFPHCKFGDKCLYLHPLCKFGSSCTKRNCSFSHVIMPNPIGSRLFPHNSGKLIPVQLQTCKYFPSCANQICPFYHPHVSKSTKYFKNSIESSSLFDSNPNLTWHAK